MTPWQWVENQKEWIANHGGNLEGYREFYRPYNTQNVELIYEADKRALEKLIAEALISGPQWRDDNEHT